jgi:pantoate--beta-alanine ligase
MILFRNSADLALYVAEKKNQQATIGFVPTMGALHRGHLSLIAQSKEQAGLTVCSIFVNPVQFNNPDDFNKYPSTLEKDILLLEENGCDVLFLPSVTEIYPDAASRLKRFELGYIETILEGKYRPGHFQGVCLVMDKLLDIVRPDLLFLGQKDFQQCLVIEHLVNSKNKKISVVICPILRERNGLAMSSRNLRLDAGEKKIAAQLHHTLIEVKNNLQRLPFLQMKKDAIGQLERKGFKVDYLELASSKTLRAVNGTTRSDNGILLIAAFLNNVRLIDNVLIKDEY